ncbi:hypothetical protein K2173_026256 [Erythroxylum novogranatense]|uniref:Pentatricopeptide repeat-containing protein n=1 Tax=Erythroxylum novogranatense TaxID=1862640 RepID=A0AAV8SBM8_9ROSI|nr:hypothetical protein K2173_026256 [Erythroxylum novogranatense]
MYPPLTSIADRIIQLLRKCSSRVHMHQIQNQIILHRLHCDSTIAHHFISACEDLCLLCLCLPLFFTRLQRPHLFTCNTLLKAFSHAQVSNIPFEIYAHMHKTSTLPNNYTYPFLLKSLSDFKKFKQALCVHTHVVKLGHLLDIYVQNSLLNVYASCGKMKLCRKMFDEMLERDVVSWTVMIMGYRNAGKYDDALIAFERMLSAGIVPNRVTMVNVLTACANFGAIEMGIWIHDFIRKNEWELDVVVGTSLIDMYLRCGRIDEGLNVFRSMKRKNTFTWNVVIKGLAFAERGQEAIWLFNRMEQDGFKADEVTFVNVLSACSHSGLVDIGRKIFSSLVGGKYGVSPNAKHYACMIDLFARAGCLGEAFKFINEMPFQPTESMWVSLLAGCRSHENLELSEIVGKKLVEVNPESSVYYVALSNLYADMGRWNDVAKVRELMKERGLKKDSGCSSVKSENQELEYGSLMQ